MKSYETLLVTQEEGTVVLTLNRPQALNALNEKLIQEMDDFIKSLKDSKSVRALIITGAGEKAFVAGADLKEMEGRDPNSSYELATVGQRVLQGLEDLHIPVIAAVNGFALGGGFELALACDFIVACKTARLGLPEVSLGLIPGYGGTQRLARQAGKAVARLVALSGDMYPAEQYEKWGAVALVTEPADLMPTCKKIAKSIAGKSPVAVKLAKRAIARGYDTSQMDGMKIEAELFQEAFQSADKVEGIKAFLEKRPPQFPGK